MKTIFNAALVILICGVASASAQVDPVDEKKACLEARGVQEAPRACGF
jgi:hypothetical protein